jgi:hypothetical protein
MSSDEETNVQGFALTASQVAYLKEKCILYQDATKKSEKDEIASKAGVHLVSEVETLTGSKMSAQKRSLLKTVSESHLLLPPSPSLPPSLSLSFCH